MGGDIERCWAMEGYGEAWIDLFRLPKLFSKATRSSLGSKSLFPGCPPSCEALTETSQAALLGEEHAVLQMLESPKDTRHLPGVLGVCPSCLGLPTLTLLSACTETALRQWSEDHPSPLALLPSSSGVALRILGARERDQRGSAQQALLIHSLTQPLIMGSQGHL